MNCNSGRDGSRSKGGWVAPMRTLRLFIAAALLASLVVGCGSDDALPAVEATDESESASRATERSRDDDQPSGPSTSEGDRDRSSDEDEDEANDSDDRDSDDRDADDNEASSANDDASDNDEAEEAEESRPRCFEPEWEDIADRSYEAFPLDRFRLSDGEYESEDGFAFVVEEHLVVVDLNGDCDLDAVVMIATNGGGSGVFYGLHILQADGRELDEVNFISLGDRTVIEDLDVNSKSITLDVILHGPDDAMCCPSQEQSVEFSFDELLGKETAPGIEVAEPQPEPEDESSEFESVVMSPGLAEAIVSRSWQYHSTSENFFNDPATPYDGFDLLVVSAMWQQLELGSPLPVDLYDRYVATAVAMDDGRWTYRTSAVASILGDAARFGIGSEQDLLFQLDTYFLYRFTALKGAQNQALGAMVGSEQAWRNVMSDAVELQQRQWTRQQVSDAVVYADQLITASNDSLSAAQFELGLG